VAFPTAIATRIPICRCLRVGSGNVKPGRHVKYKKDTPMNNLFVAMLDRANVNVEGLGDSKGRLGYLSELKPQNSAIYLERVEF
jgi:hypothetical protein